MRTHSLANIENVVYNNLEPHTYFISTGDDDDIRYMISPEVVEKLVWIIIYVLLPLLTGTTANIISDYINRKSEANAMKLSNDELLEVKREITASIEKVTRTVTRDETTVVHVKKNITYVLEVNGWPKKIAERDADALLTKFFEDD